MRPNPTSATRPLVALLLLLGGAAQAAPVGQVTNLSGPLFAINTQGVQRILSVGSKVEPGETLVTEGSTYAQVRFVDTGVVTLRPGTQFKIQSFEFDTQKPKEDSAVFSLLRGALRTLTGLIGKRGNQDAYRMNTATATIGIRGTQFIAQFVPEEQTAVSRVPFARPLLASLDLARVEAAGGAMSDVPAGLLAAADVQPFQLAQGSGAGPGGLNPGLYLQVLDGMVHLSNGGGSQNFSAGQFGYAASFTLPPVILPANPGVQFTPPPSFQITQQKAHETPPGEQPPHKPSDGGNQDKQGCNIR